MPSCQIVELQVQNVKLKIEVAAETFFAPEPQTCCGVHTQMPRLSARFIPADTSWEVAQSYDNSIWSINEFLRLESLKSYLRL
jgi:hypothetical protein